MSTVITVSVVMPVYNAGNFLRESLTSIINQTFRDFEFIIINDGSSDNSLDVINAVVGSDSRVKILSRTNKGLVFSLNEGIQLARGEFIARMDADDIAHPTRFAEQVEYLKSHPEVVCIGTGARVIDSAGRYLIDMETPVGSNKVLDKALKGRTPITHPTAMYRTSIINQIGGYDEDDYPAEDLALWLRFSQFGRIDNLPNTLIDYRIHDGSISSKRHSQQLEKIYEICRRESESRGIECQVEAVAGRPDNSIESQYEITRRHAWWAFKSRQWSTTFIYGLKCLRINPFKSDGWRIVYCSIFKRS